MKSYIHLSSITSFPIVVVITRYPEILRIFRRFFVSTVLRLLFLMNTCMNNSSHLPGIHSSLVVQVFRKILRNAIRSSEILSSLLLLIFLPACIMVNSICQAIFIKILVVNILTILIQHVCECTQSSVDPYKLSFRLGCPPEHELVLDHSNSCRLYP